MVFLVWLRGAEKIERKKKTEKKNIEKWRQQKNEEYKESQATTLNIFGFTFYVKNYILLRSIIWKKAVYTITFSLKFLYVSGYLKLSNDTPKLKRAFSGLRQFLSIVSSTAWLER